ncbi:MAG: hypothetical protein LAKADJCE_00467 [Candidatus Argoarchaeum ethanivorans]|uniref:Uncharacterized protein n=1 Tax=Candidatus Argoarchaeum ethanivorans TaxID=2608793 RepID=A0A811TBV6_9EURY|nr:MAG: hypothetical protein LAKADJCE_00467 [Candidatus Argoarchaeum ethanivorans]
MMVTLSLPIIFAIIAIFCSGIAVLYVKGEK